MVCLNFHRQGRTGVPCPPPLCSLGWDLVCLCVWLLFLPEQCQSLPVFPLRSMHTYFVFRDPQSSDTPVGGPHQSDGNTTHDISTRL